MSDPELLDDSSLHKLERIVADFTERCRRGEQPRLEHYVEQHPELSDAIRETLPVLRKLRDLSPAPDSTRDRPAQVPLPERIGDYRILGELGRGGMGVVYHAVQESLDRTVALKVLPSSALLGERSRERFRREALIAAQLHHTNIVPVFGTGQAEGVDYFAMQYIEGESLDRVIASLHKMHPRPEVAASHQHAPVAGTDRFSTTAQRLLAGHLEQPGTSPTSGPVRSSSSVSVTQSSATGYAACVARIGIQVAQALSHAHSHGVLHRDIKPSNLILDRSGTIWVTDFGLARHDDQAGLTSTGDLVGTLRYMAPERLQGKVDTRTDIYALGLTLFELLSFRPALEESDRGQLIRSILELEPSFPAEARRSIPRDLETIVLKAMAKEPAERYATAQALATDLERFLLGNTVLARPLGPLGRTWRWCRRNRVVAALAASLLVILVTGLVVVTSQWRRAESNFALAEELRARAESNLVEAHRQRDQAELNFQRARQAVDDYLITISENMLLDVPTLEPVRAELLERAKEFYEGFVKERTDDPELQAELAASYIRLGQIEHDLNGDWLPLLTRGLQMVEELSEQDVAFTDFPSWREGVYNTRSGYLRTSDVDKFRPIVNRAVAIWEPLVEEHPEVEGFRADLAGLFQMRGMVHFNVADYDAAYADFERSRELRESLVEQYPDVEKYRYALGESYTTCGMVKIRTEQFIEALRFSTRAKQLLEPIAEANPAATRLADILAAINQWIALAHLRTDNPLQALAAYQRALDIQERLSREYPYESRFQLNLASSYCMLGKSLFEAGHAANARSTYEKSFELLKRRLADYPETLEYRAAIVNAYLDLSGQLHKYKEYAAAEQTAREALPWSDDQTPEQRAQTSVVHFRIGAALEAQSRFEPAHAAFQEAIDAISPTDDQHRAWLATYLEYSARVCERLEQFAAAEASMLESITLRQQLDDVPPQHFVRGHHFRGRMLEATDELDAAEEAYRQAIELTWQADQPEFALARQITHRLVDLLRRTDRASEAESMLEDIRRRRTAAEGAQYGPEWTIAVFVLPDELAGEADLPSDWSPAFATTPQHTLVRDALDLVWGTSPLADGLPTEQFALQARCEWPSTTEALELHLQHGEQVRVYLNDELVLEKNSDETAELATLTLPSTDQPATLRVEQIQRSPGPAQLHLWATTAEVR